jgi:hypothetical protein
MIVPVITVHYDVFVLGCVRVFHTPMYLYCPEFVDCNVQPKDNAEGRDNICLLLETVSTCTDRDEVVRES